MHVRVCVCICTCINIHEPADVCVGVPACAYTCGDTQVGNPILVLPPIALCFIFESGSLSQLLIRLAFRWFLGIRARVFMFMLQGLYPLSQFPNSSFNLCTRQKETGKTNPRLHFRGSLPLDQTGILLYYLWSRDNNFRS